MDKDQQLRENRLRLLALVGADFLAVADYARIVIRGETDLPGSG
jgi:glycyl-tRNA synthetase beta subunit